MFELTVERQFSAAHAIEINGHREPLHGHNWLVRLTVAGESLDDNGLLCDFHLLEHRLGAIVGSYHNESLNGLPPFDRLNPTAENVAGHIAGEIEPILPAGVRLVSLAVHEAPGCVATYRPRTTPSR
jgi:6-pyruvoyltetrahydropterin/6-carboxytetrahydropterin synthase